MIPDSHLSACVIDLDNVQHSGFGRPAARLDPLSFSNVMRARGVIAGVVCRNRNFYAIGEGLWRACGFDIVAAGENCDRQVALTAIHYVEDAGCRDLTLVAGDGGYQPLVELIRACGARVHVMGRRGKVARQLRQAATSFEYINDLLIQE